MSAKKSAEQTASTDHPAQELPKPRSPRAPKEVLTPEEVAGRKMARRLRRHMEAAKLASMSPETIRTTLNAEVVS